MRVLVNALPVRYGGGATHLKQQLTALGRVAPELQLHNLLSPWAEVDGLPGTTEVVPVRSVATRFAYEQLRLPLRAADVLYCPANFGPLACRAPMVLTLQNPHYYRSGLAMPGTRVSRPPWKVKANHWAMRRADAIIAISHALAEEAVATVPGIADRLHVIHSGVPEWPAESEPVPGLPDRYVLSVANTAPHKRVQDVVAGWAAACDRTRGDVALVLVGRTTDEQSTHYRSLAGPHVRRLVMLGPVRRRAQLKHIYERALAMILMSTLETFSFTPGEAGLVGCPLVVSDIPVHREVTMGHAALVPLRDTGALAEVMIAGFRQWTPGSALWRWPVSWDDNARMLVDVFCEVGAAGVVSHA